VSARLSLGLARAVGVMSRRTGRGATSLPGKVLMRLDSRALERLSARLGEGSVVISATNGKTTTAAMAATILSGQGHRLVHNRAGANMTPGIVSTLLEAAGRGDSMDGELGLFEVDEFWLEEVVDRAHPRVAALCNLFRDQLDRYGELEAIADRWAALLQRNPAPGLALALNADDPLIADLGRERERVMYFGIEDDGVAQAGMAHASDSKHCRRCGHPYRYEAIYMGHLGRYACPNCGARRPTPHLIAQDIRLNGVRGTTFALRADGVSTEVELALPGLYNVYNAVAAAAIALSLGVGLEAIGQALGAARPAFGRSESVTVQGRELLILLVKNPAGANEVLRTLALEPGRHDMLAVLNDNIADGRDVSWIWDADFEALAGRIRRVTASGTRASEMALRMKYAGVDPENIRVEPALDRALDAALADTGAQAGPLFALPTYTAMLALRELLNRRGELSSSWA
jgi:lipid II isoglutaminyl synthase (glutamine-hydrolysing)